MYSSIDYRYVLVNLTVSIAKGYTRTHGPKAVSASEGKVIGSFKIRGDQSPLCVGSSLIRQIGPCNDLETEINKERARNGLGPLKCDQNMRWVANKHVENQLDNGYTDGQVRTQSLIFYWQFLSPNLSGIPQWLQWTLLAGWCWVLFLHLKWSDLAMHVE